MLLTSCYRMPGLLAATLALAPVMPSAAQNQDSPRFSTDDGFSVETTDGDFSFGIGARIQADAAVYFEDEASLGNGTEVRRARLDVEGTFFEHWVYTAEHDFADAELEFEDIYLGYAGFPSMLIKVGNFKPPFSLENMTSTKWITFMERVLSDEALVPDRRVGLGLDVMGARSSLAFGLFGDAIGSSNETDPDGGEADSGVSVAGRVTAAPVLSPDRLLHFGGAAIFRDVGRGESLQFRTRPESHVTDVRLVDTGVLNAVEQVAHYGVETAFAAGPLTAQAEYYVADLKHDLGDATFAGWYVETSYFLTGESRAAFYRSDSGDFGEVIPERPGGAWQIGLRVSHVDLTDSIFQGGEQENLSVALNWYPNPRLRFYANYIKVVDHERQGVNDQPSVFQMRAQIIF